MKLKKLFGNWTNTIRTFPISHILLLAISIIWIGNIQGSFNDHFCYRILIALGFTFLLSCLGPIINIHSSLNKKNTINRILQISSLFLGGIYYFILTRIKNIFDATYSESLIYFGVIILAVIAIPLLIAILHKKEEKKIRFSWSSLFVSIIFGSIAGSIVRGGISGALASIKALFDVFIDSDRYLYIGVLSDVLLAGSFIFNYYLTLVENINKDKSEFTIEPSRIRRIFGSFIFLPLAIIYLLIFGAYGIKILITGVRPRGIIVRLGIGYFALGIVSLYMNYPQKTKVHEIINKILYISFILIALMMIGAIVQRINQYGITINRCFICYIIAFIIIFSVLSLIFSSKRLLSFVITLSILSLIALYGPLNTGNISFKSQINRLSNSAEKENISLPLSGGALENIDAEQTKIILSSLDELVDNYNSEKIIDKVISFDYSNSYRYSARYNIRDYLKANTDYSYDYDSTYFNYRQYSENDKLIDVAGFSKLYQFSKYEGDVRNQKIKLNIEEEKYEIDLSEYMDELIEKSDTDDKSEPALILDGENYRLIITGYHGQKNSTNQKAQFNSIDGYMLIK